MRPYSKDLRLRVLAAIDAGKPREEVAQTFSVSVPTIKRWLKRRRETGDLEPKPIPGRPSLKGATLQEWLPYHLPDNKDLTIEAHRQAFEEEHGLEVSRTTVSGAIAHLPGSWPLKKVADSLLPRRGSPRLVAVAGLSLRCPRAGICGREWLSYFHDPPLRPRSQGTESLRPSTPKPRQEHHAHRCDHPRRGDGAGDDRRGIDQQGGI